MAGLLCYESENQERETDLDGVYWPCPIRCSSSESPGLYIVRENALEKETRLRGMMYNTAHSHGNTIKETNRYNKKRLVFLCFPLLVKILVDSYVSRAIGLIL